MKSIKEVFEYREMIYMLVRKELRGRYRGSVLGFAWTFLNPLLQLAVYTIVFSIIMRAGIEKYYIFLFVALVPWMAIASSVNNGAVCIISQAGMVTKIYFPRRILPIVAVSSNFINMLLSMLVVLVVCFFSIGINFSVLWYLIPVSLIEYLLALGITLLISGLTVYFRDLEYLAGIFTMAWQFMTPVMYSIDMVPERFMGIFKLNPMTPVILAFRQVLYYQTAPEMGALLRSFLVGLGVLVFGWIIFGRLERRFAEVL